MTVVASPAFASDRNFNKKEEAYSISGSGYYYQAIESSSDVDWYAWKNYSGTTKYVTVKVVRNPASSTLKSVKFDLKGEILPRAARDTGGGFPYKKVDITKPIAVKFGETVFIEVKGDTGKDIGAYELDVSVN
jgi:hypothetical protein